MKQQMKQPRNQSIVLDKILEEAYVEKEIYHLPQNIVRVGNNGRQFILRGQDLIRQVVIPKSVAIIGGNSFAYCRNLEDINLPPELEWIGVGAFSYCRNLKKIVLPDKLKKIGHSAFYECKKITSVAIPFGVHVIDKYTFYDCVSLDTVHLHDNIKKIGHGAFANTKIKKINLPKNLESMGVGAFTDTLLEEIQIPEKLTLIDRGVFSGCKLKQVIVPGNIDSLESQSFAYCEQLENIYIPDHTNIYDDAFYQSKNVTIYSGKNSNAKDYADKHNLHFVEVPALKTVSMACQKDSPELLRYLIEKHPVPNWLFDSLIIDVANRNNATKCIKFLGR